MDNISRNHFDVSLMQTGTINYQKDSKRSLLEEKFKEVATTLALDDNEMADNFKWITRKCPICLNDSIHTTVMVKYGVDIVECGGCGFWFTPAIFKATVDSMSDIWKGAFEETHISFLQSETYKKLSTIRYSYELDVIEKFAKHHHMSILDIGCGTGEFLRLAQKRDWFAYGVEANPILAKIASQFLNNIINAYFTPSLFPRELRFDTVVTLDTLEHIPDPDLFVAGIREVLAENGFLLIQVPNATSLSARLNMKQDNMFNGLIHYNYFDRQSLVRLIQRHGFELISYETVITELNSITRFDNEVICNKIREITGRSVDSTVTPDFILDNDLGYKIIALFQAI